MLIETLIKGLAGSVGNRTLLQNWSKNRKNACFCMNFQLLIGKAIKMDRQTCTFLKGPFLGHDDDHDHDDTMMMIAILAQGSKISGA